MTLNRHVSGVLAAALALSALKPPKAIAAESATSSVASLGNQDPSLKILSVKTGERIVDINARLGLGDFTEYFEAAGISTKGIITTRSFSFLSADAVTFDVLKESKTPFIVTRPDERVDSINERLAKVAPVGTKIIPHKTFEPAGICIKANLIFDADTLKFDGRISRAEKNIRELFSKHGRFSKELHSLFMGEEFKKLSDSAQEKISLAISNLYMSAIPDNLDTMCSNLRSLIGNNPGIFDSRAHSDKTIADILVEASNEEFFGIASKDFVAGLAKVLDRKEMGIYQGNKGTCSVSSMCLALASNRPAEFTQMAYSLFKTGSYDIILAGSNNVLKVTNVQHGAPINADTRDKFNGMLGNLLMEVGNGSDNYNPDLDRNENDKGEPQGDGLSSKKLKEMIIQILHEEYDIYSVGKNVSEDTINRLCKSGLMIASIKWSKSSPEEIEKILKEKGGKYESRFDKDGYGSHSLHLIEVKDGEVYFSTSWNHEGHAQDKTVPVIYVKDAIIKMPFDEFLSRSPMIIARKNNEPELNPLPALNNEKKGIGIEGILLGLAAASYLGMYVAYVSGVKIRPGAH